MFCRACGADETKPAAPAGIRQIESKHLTLITDLPAGDDVDALPAIFDQAFPQWCAYFGVDEKQHADWHVRGYLMRARERFQAAGLFPADLPEFATGFARGDRLWVYDQASPYYRRHLVLHEGTHAFMDALASGKGPPWFSEGMAELLATHRLEDGKLVLKYFPRDRDEVSKWGRIEIVQTAYAARCAMSLAKIFAFDSRVELQNHWYAWCWAATAFFDGHPRYQSRFRDLHKQAGQPNFSGELRRVFGDDWNRIQEDWQVFIANLDYGYDFARMDVEPAAGTPLPPGGKTVSVAADRGWQSSGVQLAAGQKVRLRATGRYQVGNDPGPWWCEPGGVTIHYYRGLPLGILLAAIRSDDPAAKGPSGLLKPITVGLETTLESPHAGTLYFRINDSAGSLNDNAGSLEVEITTERMKEKK